MVPPVHESTMLTALKTESQRLGLVTRLDGPDALAGEIEAVRSTWWLGGRTVTYRFACRLDGAAHCVRCREGVIEKSWGIPPPSFCAETTISSGWERCGSLTEASTGGGGTLDHGRVREALGAAAERAGWRFELEPGRVP